MLSYAITDKENFSFSSINRDLNRISKKANMVLYRDKDNPNYEDNGIKFFNVARRLDFNKIIIHNDIDLALKLKTTGIHFSSNLLPLIRDAKNLGLFTIGSCHNQEEIDLAQELGADMVTLSPLFSTPNKGTPLGKDKFKKIVLNSTVPIIALGGIVSKKEIKIAKSLGAVGFASIRYFA